MIPYHRYRYDDDIQIGRGAALLFSYGILVQLATPPESYTHPNAKFYQERLKFEKIKCDREWVSNCKTG